MDKKPNGKRDLHREPWTDDHTLALLRSTVHLVLANRRDIYAPPSLHGVSYNGGNAINQKLQQMLRRFCAGYPGGQGVVDEVVGG
ncbi:hypothetical protein EHS25_003216 [Saitozyma podzolica]|uniref:Uncharacterized protein n=1 Tax=Saitozyma podzolica TaxID=1890683 RepID=A0A427Y8E0_9TREE|nr:hypothetical protein EHS25_003216 [Saitozyma podzolica]